MDELDAKIVFFLESLSNEYIDQFDFIYEEMLDDPGDCEVDLEKLNILSEKIAETEELIEAIRKRGAR